MSEKSFVPTVEKEIEQVLGEAFVKLHNLHESCSNSELTKQTSQLLVKMDILQNTILNGGMVNYIKLKIINESVIMNTDNREILIREFISMRGYYYNFCDEKIEKFLDKYQKNPLKDIVIKYLDTSFRDVHQTAEKAIEEYLDSQKQ